MKDSLYFISNKEHLNYLWQANICPMCTKDKIVESTNATTKESESKDKF